MQLFSVLLQALMASLVFAASSSSASTTDDVTYAATITVTDADGSLTTETASYNYGFYTLSMSRSVGSVITTVTKYLQTYTGPQATITVADADGSMTTMTVSTSGDVFETLSMSRSVGSVITTITKYIETKTYPITETTITTGGSTEVLTASNGYGFTSVSGSISSIYTVSTTATSSSSAASSSSTTAASSTSSTTSASTTTTSSSSSGKSNNAKVIAPAVVVPVVVVIAIAIFVVWFMKKKRAESKANHGTFADNQDDASTTVDNRRSYQRGANNKESV